MKMTFSQKLFIIFVLFFCNFLSVQKGFALNSSENNIHVSSENDIAEEEILAENDGTTEATTLETESEETLNPSVDENMPPVKSKYTNISFRERIVFKLHYLNESQRDETLKRAQKASSALEEAMNANDPLEPNSKPANVFLAPNKHIEVRVRGYKIIELTPEDIRASGYKSANEYAEDLQTELNIFVGNEFQRLQIQKLALKFFLSVFFALMGFLILRQTRIFFNNADLNIEEKRESLKPMTFMSETLISSQALGGLFALFLVIGRVFTYGIVILTTCAAILGQFTITRNIMGELFTKVFSDSIANIQSLIELLPGFVFAILLLFLWNLSIKILDLFLKGVRSGRISWSFLRENRISIVRFWGISLLSLIFFPLVLASMFGRFNSPLESVIIACAIILFLSTLPILISIAAGSFILWFGQVYPGQWIKVGGVIGEVTDVTLFKITLVPQEGGRIYIPMLQLLFKSYYEISKKDKKEFHFKIQRTMGLKETISAIENIFPSELNVQVSCNSLSGSEYHLSLSTSHANAKTKNEILTLISEAHDRKIITLTSEFIEESLL